LEGFYPYDIEIDFEEFIENFVKERFADVHERIDQYGMKPRGQARVTKDLRILA